VRVVELFQVRACGARGLDHEATQSRRDRLRLGGQEGRPRRGVAERDRDQVERAALVVLHVCGSGFVVGVVFRQARGQPGRW